MKRVLLNKICQALYNDINNDRLINEQVPPQNREEMTGIFLSWSSEIDQIISELYKVNDLMGLAKVYEIAGIFDSNLSDSEPVYYATTLQCSSYFYYAVGEKEISKAVAMRNYTNYLKHYSRLYNDYDDFTPENLLIIEDFNDKDRKLTYFTESTLHSELLGDMCLFFNQDLAKHYYSNAKRKISVINQVDESYKTYLTSQYSWWIPSDHYFPVLKRCFGLDLSALNNSDFSKRIEKKEELFKMISI